MTGLSMLIRRNCRLFFKDKGMFFTSLITPAILLVLYITFLGDTYRSSFESELPPFLPNMDALLDGFVGGQLFSSLLSVCCVTVAFCCNLLMVQDKVSGARRDLTMSPVKNSTLALGYYIATVISTLLVCLTATELCFLYLWRIGWYLSLLDVVCLLLDTVLLVLFGTALSSIINLFLSTQGQISAVGTVVSAGYGFICGAYMPISQFGEGLQKALSFLPSTYGTALVRNHALRGVFSAMLEKGFPAGIVDEIKTTVDCCPRFLNTTVDVPAMYLILGGTTAALIVLYVLLSAHKKEA